MKRMLPALLLATCAASANADAADTSQRETREAKELAKALEGKVAGEPVKCVSTWRGQNLRAIDENTLLYRVSKKLVYRNDLQGACHGLRYGDTLVVTIFGDEYCRGDLARSVNPHGGTLSGSCALGDFVPYTASGG